MNKELAIHLVIGTAAVCVIYYLYTRLKTGTTADTPTISDELTSNLADASSLLSGLISDN